MESRQRLRRRYEVSVLKKEAEGPKILVLSVWHADVIGNSSDSRE